MFLPKRLAMHADMWWHRARLPEAPFTRHPMLTGHPDSSLPLSYPEQHARQHCHGGGPPCAPMH